MDAKLFIIGVYVVYGVLYALVWLWLWREHHPRRSTPPEYRSSRENHTR